MMIVNTLESLVTDEHLVSTGFWQEHEHPTEGTLRFSSPPATLSKTPASIDRLPPRLGEHTCEVLKEIGYAAKEVDTLIGDGNVYQCENV